MPAQPPTPEQARLSLDQAMTARAAAAEASRRPVWLDATLALGCGAGMGLASVRTTPMMVTGLAAVLVAAGVYAVLARRAVRRRGRVLDQRAVGAQMGRYLLAYGVVFAVALFGPVDAWQPWYSIGAGLVTAIAGFAVLRWEDRYQTRRLASDDHEPYDVL